MDVNQIYVLMQTIVSKNVQDGYLSPDDFYNYINQAQRSYLDYLLGEYQQYQQQRPISVVQFGTNERVRQSISPLIYGTILVPDASGVAPFPSDYEYNDAMWTMYGLYNIKFIQQDRWSSYHRSVIDPVESNPVYLINHDGFQFDPPNIGFAKMSYVRTPPSIVWGYVYDSNGVPVYDASTSQQPVWAETDIYLIIARALALFGVQVSAPTIMQHAQDIKMRGQ